MLLDPLFYGIRGTLADAAAFDVHAAHAGSGDDGYEGDMRLPMVMVPVLSSMRTIDVAGRFDVTAAGGHDVAAYETVDAADADGAEQSADSGRDQAD